MPTLINHLLTRRQALGAAVCTIGAVTFSRLGLAQTTKLATTRPAKAKAVIQLWMGGGPTHLDTFDPKPDAGDAFCGQLRKPIGTNVAGMRISEMFPNLAKQADKYCIIRSMTHGSNAHETATYMMQTCTKPATDMVYPAVGAIVAKKCCDGGYSGKLPPYITVANALGRFTECGFLGPEARTFATGGDPSAAEFIVNGLVPQKGISDERIAHRRDLLELLDSRSKVGASGEQKAMLDYQKAGFEMILGDARKAFDLSQEKAELRDRYGRTRFGQSCLVARRLVEQGVPFVTVNYPGWDTHRDHFAAMRRLLPPLDAGFATLLADLSERGMLDSTIVTWFGEFGRTPRVLTEPPWNGGRGHYGPVFSSVVAGGGFKGGCVLGESDKTAEAVKDRPVYPWDLAATMYTLLGIDPMGTLPHPTGCVAHIQPKELSGTLLKEII